MKEGNSDGHFAEKLPPSTKETQSHDTSTDKPNDLFTRLLSESPSYRHNIDKDQDLSFSRKELDDVTKDPNAKPALKEFSQVLKDNFELVGNLDNVDGSKNISHRDAYKLWELHAAKTEADTLTRPVAETLKNYFKDIDTNGDGKLSISELESLNGNSSQSQSLRKVTGTMASWMKQRDKFDDQSMTWASKDGITREGLDQINAKDVSTVLQKRELNKPRVEMTNTNSLWNALGGTPKATQETVAQTNERYNKLNQQGLDKLLDRFK